MKQEPTVVSGVRTISNRTPVPSDEGESGRPKPNVAFSAIPAGKRVFQAKAGRYRIQLTAPERLRFADGRIVEGDRPKVVQFADYIAVFDETKDADTIKLIEGHRDYKTDFWDLKDVLVKAKSKRVEDALKLIASDEEARSAILEALTMGEGAGFELPQK